MLRRLFDRATHHIREPAVLARTADGIVLRRMRWDTDGRTVCAFQNDVYSVNFPDFKMTPRFLLGFEEGVRQGLVNPDHGLFVLEDAGRLVGFLWIVVYVSSWTGERYGYINNIYVIPSHRGRGLGRFMMEYTDEFLRERGVLSVRLTVTAANRVAVHLYERAGYHIERYEMQKQVPPAPGTHPHDDPAPAPERGSRAETAP